MKKRIGESPLKFAPIAASMAGGLVKAGLGLIGGGKRKAELARAQRAYDMQKQRYENMDTSNPYANMENVYEDATVNTQQADTIKQQQMQSQANTMDQFSQAAGGSGIAALAQAMSQQQSQNAQQAASSIGQQEQANQANTMQAASSIQNQKIQGDILSRKAEMSKVDSLMQTTGQELQGAQANKAAYDQMAISGLGDIGKNLMGFTPL
jgi:hypothetical protein